MVVLPRTAHINNFMYGRLERPDLRDGRDIRTRAHIALLFKVAIPKNEAFKRSGSCQWNSLPAEVCNTENYDVSKAKQKSQLYTWN